MRTKLETKDLMIRNNAIDNRIRETITWLDKHGGRFKGNIADIGETNLLKKAISRHFDIQIKSLDFNFNYPFKSNIKHDVIFAFEVLEHCYNPLTLLESIKDSLTDNGYIYLSTPYQYPQILIGRYHYHEIPSSRLMWLFEEAHLKIIEKGKITIAGNWYNHIYGIRPFLRYFQKTRIYKLQKM